MPLQYKRKSGVARGKWTEFDLTRAVQAHADGIGVNEAANMYGIPKSTFKRRLKNKQLTKSDVLGPCGVLTTTNEKKIVTHIIKLQQKGFTPSREAVRKMAFNLAEKLQIKHTFNRDKKMAGFGWLESFLRRNPELSIRKSEGVSQARAKGMDKERVDGYFSLLKNVMQEYGLFNKPGSIFNMDETGLQLNNRPGMVVAAKGSKSVPTITSGEKGETISIIACCSGEGFFLPPYCIMKGKNKKAEFEDGMPPGSVVKMSQKSAYVTSEIFFDWLKNHFVPRKPEGKCVLILDGHSSHCSDVEMLEYADQHDIVIICLPSHTTHYLQPLDRAFFKSLKTFYYDECNRFIRTNPSRKLTRLQFGKLLASAWNRSACANNAIAGFSSTGIIPFNENAIPDYAFLASNTLSNESNQHLNLITHQPSTSFQPSKEARPQPSTSRSCQAASISFQSSMSDQAASFNPQPSTSKQAESISTQPSSNQAASFSIQPTTFNQTVFTSEDLTPGKILDIVSPVPCVEKTRGVRQRSRQVAEVLNSFENIQNIKNKGKGKKSKQVAEGLSSSENIKNVRNKGQGKKSNNEKQATGNKRQKKEKENVAIKKLKKKREESTDDSSESDLEVISLRDSPEIIEWNDSECAGCEENYDDTLSRDDWLQCTICERWSHESCTKYKNMCERCGDTLTN